MKTAYMGTGDVIVSKLSHPKLKGMLLCFNKSKRPLEVKELKAYKKDPIDMKDVGRGLFQVYFPNKESFGRFIEHLNCIYENEEWL